MYGLELGSRYFLNVMTSSIAELAAAAAPYPEARITRFGTDWGCGKCAITHIAIGTRHYTNHQKTAETWHVNQEAQPSQRNRAMFRIIWKCLHPLRTKNNGWPNVRPTLKCIYCLRMHGVKLFLFMWPDLVSTGTWTVLQSHNDNHRNAIGGQSNF